jgi:hypothetical protein
MASLYLIAYSPHANEASCIACAESADERLLAADPAFFQFRKSFAEDARGGVVAAARRRRHDANGLGGIVPGARGVQRQSRRYPHAND